MRATALSIAPLLALLAAPALSDETWRTPAGLVIYEQDMGMIAVLSFPVNAAFPMRAPEFAEDRAMIFLPGMAGNYDDRSVSEGFWMAGGMPGCAVQLSFDGESYGQWGRVLIQWDRPSFPTGFTMLVGDCFADPSVPVRADLP